MYVMRSCVLDEAGVDVSLRYHGFVMRRFDRCLSHGERVCLRTVQVDLIYSWRFESPGNKPFLMMTLYNRGLSLSPRIISL